MIKTASGDEAIWIHLGSGPTVRFVSKFQQVREFMSTKSQESGDFEKNLRISYKNLKFTEKSTKLKKNHQKYQDHTTDVFPVLFTITYQIPKKCGFCEKSEDFVKMRKLHRQIIQIKTTSRQIPKIHKRRVFCAFHEFLPNPKILRTQPSFSPWQNWHTSSEGRTCRSAAVAPADSSVGDWSGRMTQPSLKLWRNWCTEFRRSHVSVRGGSSGWQQRGRLKRADDPAVTQALTKLVHRVQKVARVGPRR